MVGMVGAGVWVDVGLETAVAVAVAVWVGAMVGAGVLLGSGAVGLAASGTAVAANVGSAASEGGLLWQVAVKRDRRETKTAVAVILIHNCRCMVVLFKLGRVC